uniref:Uncharacterized protein n=1 Tax=Arundo donax TaxID=35708 RepID=A0A0A8YEC1_ARUDO
MELHWCFLGGGYCLLIYWLMLHISVKWLPRLISIFFLSPLQLNSQL